LRNGGQQLIRVELVHDFKDQPLRGNVTMLEAAVPPPITALT
jgi:hypothetical protein